MSKQLLLGDEAIAQAALDAGLSGVYACVVFKKAKPSKKDYRKYLIKTVVGPDDYASLMSSFSM